MKNLKEKCRNERYHQTIRFFYHRLPNEEKLSFILNVADANILLASQCLMSDKKDEAIENTIKIIAIDDAQNFDDTAKSTAGLLALAEFQLYDTILEIFNSLIEPKRIHLLVLTQLFREADEEVYFKFIETFTNYDKIGLLLTTFMSYKGTLSLNKENIQILQNLLIRLIEKKYSGFVRVYLNTYDLWQSIEIIFGSRLDEIIDHLLTGNEKSVTLAYYLVEYTNRFHHFPADNFISNLGQKKISKKAIGLALQIAQTNSIFDNKKLNQTLTGLIKIGPLHKTNSKKIKFLIRKGLAKYTEHLPGLSQQLNQFIINSSIIKREFYNEDYHEVYLESESEYFNRQTNSLIGLKIIFGEIEDPAKFRNEFTLLEFWRVAFDFILGSHKKIILEEIIIDCVYIYDTDYKHICAALKTFTHIGMVKKIENHGYYVHPFTFSSMDLCFLHHSLSTKINHKEMQFSLEVGQTITFNIVGFNSTTSRININLV